MKKSKLVALIAGSTAAVAIGIGGVTYAYAQDATVVKDKFVSILAEKLGVPEDKIAKAVEQTRIQLHNEREAQVDKLINDALNDGKLTQRQVDILNAMQDIREKHITDRDRPERGRMKETMIEELKEEGLKVTEDELMQLHDALRELGIEKFGHGKGKKMHIGM